MRSIWTIAELVWRQLHPAGSDEAKNTLEEYVEAAKDEMAALVFQFYYQAREEGDFSIIEPFLFDRALAVEQSEEGPFVTLDRPVLDLPKDSGVWAVRLHPRGEPLTKTTRMTYDLFRDDPAERRPYYRSGQRLYFPEGVEGVKKVYATVASSEAVEDSLEVPNHLAAAIAKALAERYGASLGVPVDETNNGNSNINE